MLVVMRRTAGLQEVAAVEEKLRQLGLRVRTVRGARVLILVEGDASGFPCAQLESLPGVEKVFPEKKAFLLARREVKGEKTLVKVGEVVFGGREVVVIAGPCAVESREQLAATAHEVHRAGARVLRGGAFKPRTSPYSFQGLGVEGLRILRDVGAATGMATVAEVVDEASLEAALEYVDMVQVGARNMQNFSLLKHVGRAGKPVLLKRGFAATVEEWLLAAEYILAEGNENVVLCERGIRTFESATRNTLDLSAVPLVKELSHLPVIVDPSHATGRRNLVLPMARAAIAAGADGLMVEVHPDPDRALSDGPQSLLPEEFALVMAEIAPVAAAVGRLLKPGPEPQTPAAQGNALAAFSRSWYSLA